MTAPNFLSGALSTSYQLLLWRKIAESTSPHLSSVGLLQHSFPFRLPIALNQSAFVIRSLSLLFNLTLDSFHSSAVRHPKPLRGESYGRGRLQCKPSTFDDVQTTRKVYNTVTEYYWNISGTSCQIKIFEGNQSYASD